MIAPKKKTAKKIIIAVANIINPLNPLFFYGDV
jgi:hypothetical protein